LNMATVICYNNSRCAVTCNHLVMFDICHVIYVYQWEEGSQPCQT